MATTAKGIPYPLSSDNNDAAGDMQAIADWLNDFLGAKTTAQIAALSGAALWIGRQVFDSDTGDWKYYNGSSWVITGIPVGSVYWSAEDGTVAGGLVCDGASYATATYPHLHAKIGYTYGGSGSNFNVPDLRNRFVAGLGTQSEFNVVGETGGSKTVTLTTSNLPSHSHSGPSHSHTGPSHSHSSGSLITSFGGNHSHIENASRYDQLINRNLSSLPADGAWDVWEGVWGSALVTQSDGVHQHTLSGSTASGGTGSTGLAGTGSTGTTGSGTAATVLNPYIVLKPFIKT